MEADSVLFPSFETRAFGTLLRMTVDLLLAAMESLKSKRFVAAKGLL
jgi:hypothetical protein